MKQEQEVRADLQEAAIELAQPSKAEVPATEKRLFMAKWGPFIDAVARVVTVGIFGLALLQYWDAGQERREVRSLSLVEEWVDKGFPARLMNLNSYIFETVAESKREIEQLPEGMREKAWQNSDRAMFEALATPESEEARQLRSDVDAIFLFFARANICIASEICAPDIINAYFYSEIVSLLEEFEPFVASIREKGLKTYARGAEDLYHKMKADYE
jgi:hypothetical protein